VLGDPEASEYAVWVDRRPFPAKVRAADPWSDLAVLEIDATDLAPMPLGSGKNARKGQIVIALGNPYAIARDGSPSATWGIVSNLSRKAPPTPTRDAPSGKETLHHFGTLIQTDARLSLGTSGGALLNLDGEMIGLTTSMAALSGLEKSAGFAIPVDDLFRRVVDRLKQGRDVEYGFLGIEPEPLGLRELQRGEHGIRLGEVVNGTPAATAGLKRDDVVTHVDSQPVFDGDHLILLLSSRPVDETVRLTLQRFDPVLRRPRTRHKDVELSKKHVAANRAAIVSVQPPLWRGLTVDYATAVPRFHLLARQKVDGQWVVDPQGCVAVVDVAPQSTAWEAGIRPGLFVSHVQGQRVVKPAEFQAAVAQRDGPVELTFTSPVGQHRDVELAP